MAFRRPGVQLPLSPLNQILGANVFVSGFFEIIKRVNKMGHIFGVKCEKCDYKFKADVGHGMRGCGFFEINPEANKPYFVNYIKHKNWLISRITN